MLSRFTRFFSTKSPEFYAAALANHQHFARIDLDVSVLPSSHAL